MSDDGWIVEGIAQFLRSPLWTTPIHNFIDENCIVFASNVADTSSIHEQPLQHLLLHKRFRELVDSLLTGYIDELGVPAEAVMTACQRSGNPDGARFVEYVYALDSYPTFALLLQKRNAALEREAMEQLGRTLQLAHSSSSSNGSPARAAPTAEQDAAAKEQADMDAAIAASLAEMEAARQKAAELEDAELQKALQLSLVLENQRLEREKELVELEAEHLRRSLLEQQAAQQEQQRAAEEERRLKEQLAERNAALERESQKRQDEIHAVVHAARVEVAVRATQPAAEPEAAPIPPVPAVPATKPTADEASLAPAVPAIVAAPETQAAAPAQSSQPTGAADPVPQVAAQSAVSAESQLVAKPGLPEKPMAVPGLGAIKGRSGAAFGSFAKLPTRPAPTGPSPTFAELKSAVAGPQATPAPQDAEAIAQQAEKWRKQRELLLAMKREEREKELSEYRNTQMGGPSAPTSAASSSPAPVTTAAHDADFARQLARRFREDIIEETKKLGGSTGGSS